MRSSAIHKIIIASYLLICILDYLKCKGISVKKLVFVYIRTVKKYCIIICPILPYYTYILINIKRNNKTVLG